MSDATKITPRDPTPEMVKAAANADVIGKMWDEIVLQVWQLMWDEAPEADPTMLL